MQCPVYPLLSRMHFTLCYCITMYVFFKVSTVWEAQVAVLPSQRCTTGKFTWCQFIGNVYARGCTLLQKWPTDYVLHVWYPRHCQLEEDSGSHPPSSITNNRGHPAQNTLTSSASSHNSTQRTDSLFKRSIAHCIKPQYGDTGGTTDEKLSSSSDHFELTKLAEAGLEHKELPVMGFHLSLCGVREGREEGGGDNGTVLQLSTWRDGSIRKADFIKQG